MLNIRAILFENIDPNYVKVDFSQNRSNISHKMDDFGGIKEAYILAVWITDLFKKSIL